MLKILATKLFGSANDRLIKSYKKIVEIINTLEPTYIKMSDENLKSQTQIFKDRLAAGETLDDILPNAFAVIRETAKRTLGERHFDVQLLGGIVLHNGMITEMKTGEGKTLVSTLPVYLNALTEKGVHVVTVNDYLAKRDAEWMGTVYTFLGLTVDCITHELDDEQRKQAYNCDVTYGTNNEFGFDYLRDNMKYSIEHMAQRDFNYAIIDEVDSILIDEARTPLIISGATDDNSQLYHEIDKIIPYLKETDYKIEEKDKTVFLTEEGTERIEKLLKERKTIEKNDSLYDIQHVELVHHVNQALRAHKLFTNEVDYLIRDDQVLIVDEFTGRVMEGRRFSEGLHSALEAKEKVKIQNENQTLASITFQNYFRMYPKLAGMTGTAMTEAAEFEHIYKLKPVEIPTNEPIARKDDNDEIYKTVLEKYDAIVKQIEACVKKQQPVLVGTVSIENSELLSNLLKKRKIPHQILNAKHHEKEAHIIAQAGSPGTVTIATNMAGRGTDIKLGGNPDFIIEDILQDITDEKKRKEQTQKITEKVKKDKQIVLKAHGLYILGTERHESRRIDNQLRGRSGRQGDPGNSKFFLSLEDDLMRIFGSDKLQGMLGKLGMKKGEAIIHPWISKALEKAQQKVENHHYETRKTLLKYDDIINEQRKIIYEQRKDLIKGNDLSSEIEYLIKEKNTELVNRYSTNDKSYTKEEENHFDILDQEIERIYGLDLHLKNFTEQNGIAQEEILNKINSETTNLFKEKEDLYGDEIMRVVEKRIFLMTLDRLWKDHLCSLDKLRKGIGLRAYGQKDPLNEYKKDSFKLFENLLYGINEQVIKLIAHVKINSEEDDTKSLQIEEKKNNKTKESRTDFINTMQTRKRKQEQATQTVVVQKVDPSNRDPQTPETWGKVSRNEPCPCDSGKKYKQCCGKIL